MKIQSTTKTVRTDPLDRKRIRNRRKRRRRNRRHRQKMTDFTATLTLLTSHFSFLTL